MFEANFTPKQAVLMSIRDVTDKTTTLLVHLLKRFADTNVVTSTQMTEVFFVFYLSKNIKKHSS